MTTTTGLSRVTRICMLSLGLGFAVTAASSGTAEAIEWCQLNQGEHYFEGAPNGAVVVQPALTNNMFGQLLRQLEGPSTYSHAVSIDHNAGYEWDHQFVDTEEMVRIIRVAGTCDVPVPKSILDQAAPGYVNNGSKHGARNGYVLKNVVIQCPTTTAVGDAGNIYLTPYGLDALVSVHRTGIARNTCSGLLKHKCGATAAPHSLNLTSSQVKALYGQAHDVIYSQCMNEVDWNVLYDLFCSSKSTMCHRIAFTLVNKIALNVFNGHDLRSAWSSYFRGTVPHASPKDLVRAYPIKNATTNKMQPPIYGVCTNSGGGNECSFFCD